MWGQSMLSRHHIVLETKTLDNLRECSITRNGLWYRTGFQRRKAKRQITEQQVDETCRISALIVRLLEGVEGARVRQKMLLIYFSRTLQTP